MPTVICDTSRIAFIHVPKCAGSSIGVQLARRVDCDPFFVQMRFVTHPKLGRMHPSHVPLALMRDHFPDALSRIRSYESYAVLREPGARFLSALSQHMREVQNLDPGDADMTSLQALARKVMAAFRAGTPGLYGTYVHFLPQASFLTLDGELVVRELYGMGDLAALSARLQDRLGLRLEREEKANVTHFFRDTFTARAIRSLAPGIKRLVPERTFTMARQAILPQLTRSRPNIFPRLLEWPELVDFLIETYDHDRRLLAALAPSKA